MNTTIRISILILSIGLYTHCSQPAKEQAITPEEAKAITKEAYIFTYPMLDHYKTLSAFAIDEDGSGYEGPRNTFVHKSTLPGPEFRTIVAPNNNVINSAIWFDFSAGPLVVTTPPIPEDRHFVFQFCDYYTHNYAYISPRSTGFGGGKYLMTGPDWEGETPEGITDVFKSEGDISFMIFRVFVANEADLPGAKEIQDGMKLETLDEYLGKEPSNAPLIEYEVYDDQIAKSIDFISYVNFIMTHVDIHPTEAELFKKFEKIGIAPGKDFDKSALDPEVAKAMEEGVQEALKEIADHLPNIGREVNAWSSFGNGFGNREAMQGRYLDRATAAMIGLYGNDPEENYTYAGSLDTDGEALDGSKYKYSLTFEKGETPPVYGFWSITMYDEDVLMIENPINRYSISGKGEHLQYAEDGSLTLYFQSESPRSGNGRKLATGTRSTILIGL